MRSLWQLFLVRVRVFLREPEAVFWTFGFPILIAVALGIAFRARGPDQAFVAVEDGYFAEQMATALAADPEISVVVDDAVTAGEKLRTGKVALVVVAGDPVVFRFDPTRPESREARLMVESALDRAKGRPRAFESRAQPMTEKGSRYIDFLIPGLIGMNIMSASMWGIGWSVVEARSKKLLKRLAATPMPRSQYLLAFILGHVVLVAGLLAAVLLFANVAFGVKVFGSYLSLAAVSLAGALSFAGLGVLMCSRTESSEVLSGMNNAVMLPMFVGSGVFFSSSHFPAILQPVIRILPLTAMNEALRAIMTDGASITTLGFQLAVLAVWGIGCFALGLRWFRWT